jgi:predicted homoserine dehydrogenase-like protein
MIIVDQALARRAAEGRPVRVAMIGAGFMGRGIALQILTAVRGMELVAIANRRLDGAARCYREAGVDAPRVVDSAAALQDAIRAGVPAISDDADVVCDAAGIDAVLEVTGTVEFGAQVALRAIRAGKHVVLMNAELDATLGPILKSYADRAGVVITNSDGDQPGVTMNLYREVVGFGVTPRLCGNIKGFHDRARTPATQAEFAARWGQNPYMVTAFTDGSKIAFEQALVANATGMTIGQRGMHGPTVAPGTFIREAAAALPLASLSGGEAIVDYIVGAEPSPGVFVLGTHDHPTQRHYLELYKLGGGPLYCFYRPYHLCHLEAPSSVARAVLFGDATIAPLGAPRVEVVAAAKTDLAAGTRLDAIGGYTTYGLCERADITAAERLLPLGVAVDCRLRRPVARDAVLTYDDIELPAGRLCDRLRAEQAARFPLEDSTQRRGDAEGIEREARPWAIV